MADALNFCAGSFGCLPDDQLDDCEDIANLLEELPGAVEELVIPGGSRTGVQRASQMCTKLNPMALFTHRLQVLIPVGVTMQRSRSGVDWVRFLRRMLTILWVQVHHGNVGTVAQGSNNGKEPRFVPEVCSRRFQPRGP